MRLLVILLFCAFASRAADKIVISEKELTLPPYRQFTLRDGLPQMQVISMFQDSRGYIWIGTKKGLACFNGERFTSYTTRNGLADDYIHDLAEDYSGNIWISTSLGLACFNGREITAYPLPEKTSHRISPAPDGAIWIISGDRFSTAPICSFRNGKYEMVPLNLPGNSSPVISNDILFNDKEKSVLCMVYPNIYEFSRGKLNLLFTSNDTLILIKTIKGKPFFVNLKDRQNMDIFEIQSGKPLRVAQVVKGKLSGQTLLQETLHFSMSQADFPVFTISPDTFFTAKLHGIQKNQFLYDRDGQLWIGSEEGLYHVYSGAFTTFKKEYLPQVWSILEDDKANMWFASFHFGLKQYDGMSLQTYPGTGGSGKFSGFYFHPSRDRQGRLHFPYNYGVMVLSGRSAKSIGTNPPYLSTFYDKERDLLWAGSMKKAEVFDGNHRLIRSIGIKEGLATQRYILCIQKDAGGNYWLGSTGALSKYRWETGELTNYTVENRRLPSERILTICTDFRKRTWFGSSEGLLWYDAVRDSICRLVCDDLNESVNLIAAIDSSWLLVSQPAGIYLMDLQAYYTSGEVKLHLFNSANGFTGIEPGQDGAFTDSKGNIWMNTGTEVVRLDPRKLRMSHPALNMRISRINGQNIPFSQKKTVFPLKTQTAILEFDAICFNRPKPVQYSWKLEEDKGWSPWQESNYAVLSGLGDGKQSFQVRARVPGLPITDFAYSEIVLQVKLALWKQAWFFPALFGLLAVIALGTMVLLLKTRVKMSEANRQTKVFQMQAIQSQMNPHFIFNALASLQSMILSVNMEKANEYLVKLSALIRGFLEASVSTGMQGNENNGKMEISLNEELATLENYISFQRLIYPGRFDYQLDIDPGIDPAIQTTPPMLLQPFVENAIRHGLLPKKGKGTLKIQISPLQEDGLLVVIADDGIGMEQAGNTIHKSPFRFVSRGRELTLQRIRLMNETGYHIKLDTDSSDKGTIVKLELSHKK